MPSRRKRKRERRRAENPPLRGDRNTPLWRERGTLRHDWENASRSDLHLFRRALRERWAIPAEHCRPLLDAALAAAFQGRSFRLRHVAMLALIDAGDYDLAMQRRQRAAREAAYERAAEAAARGDTEAAVAAISSTLDTPEGRELFDAVFNEVGRSGPPGVAQDGLAPADGPAVAPQPPDSAAATPVAPAAATAADQEVRRQEQEEAARKAAEAARPAGEAVWTAERQAEGLRRYYERATASEAAYPPPPASMFCFLGIVTREPRWW